MDKPLDIQLVDGQTDELISTLNEVSANIDQIYQKSQEKKQNPIQIKKPEMVQSQPSDFLHSISTKSNSKLRK